MQYNFAITLQNFVRKFSGMMELLIVKFLVMKITISNIVSEKRKLDDCDYLDRFLLRFHAVINMYSADFLD